MDQKFLTEKENNIELYQSIVSNLFRELKIMCGWCLVIAIASLISVVIVASIASFVVTVCYAIVASVVIAICSLKIKNANFIAGNYEYYATQRMKQITGHR